MPDAPPLRANPSLPSLSFPPHFSPPLVLSIRAFAYRRKRACRLGMPKLQAKRDRSGREGRKGETEENHEEEEKSTGPHRHAYLLDSALREGPP